MQRILLLMESRENARLLADRLSARYRVIFGYREQDLEQQFDLCIVDGGALDAAWQAVRARKESAAPVLLPVLLVTNKQDAHLNTRQLWQVVDEFISVPVEPFELLARIEMLLRARRQSLHLKHRNDDLEALSQALGHDLRAPVRIAGSFARALDDNVQEPLGPENRRYVARIRAAVEDMDVLIASLLELSRLGREEVQLRAVAVSAVVESCRKSLEDDIQAREAEIDVAESLPRVQADTFLLKMALSNLIGNALKFVDPGTHPVISVYATEADGLCRVNVRDRGIGIAADDAGRIFQPFVRLYGEEDYPGVGLGLATVRKAAELMGGRVGVESTPGRGSTFWVELPFADEDGAAHSPDVVGRDPVAAPDAEQEGT